MPDLTLKERMNRRLEGMKQIRQPFEAEAREIASYTMPARSRWLTSATNKRRTPNNKLNNSHGIFALRTLQGGMTSGLSSGSRPWFTLGSTVDELSENPEVRMWMSEVERRMYGFFASTNFYSAVKTGYQELGGFGTEACIMLEHPDEGAVCHQLTFGEYYIGLGSALTPEALYRHVPMTVLQARQMFGKTEAEARRNLSKRINDSYDASRYDEPAEFIHAVETNIDFEDGVIGWRGKPWSSAYFDVNCNDKDMLARQGGYEEQPFWAPRWDTVGGDVYGTGPGHDALPDLREIQLQTRRKAEATDNHVWPEMIASSKVKLKRQPKSVVNMAGADMKVDGVVDVPYQIPYQTIGVIREDVMQCRDAINQALYADLFMAITNMQGIQPRNIEEIAARNEEKLTQLGPVIERVNNEKLEVAIERVFGIMQRGNMLPPAPEVMRDSPDVKIDFISILTQMQRMVGLGQIERTVSFVATLAATYPNARFKLDANELIDEYASRAGAPAKIIRTTEDAQADADAEAQAAQQAMAAEQAAKVAPAASVAVDAAALMSEGPGDALLPLMP